MARIHAQIKRQNLHLVLTPSPSRCPIQVSAVKINGAWYDLVAPVYVSPEDSLEVDL